MRRSVILVLVASSWVLTTAARSEDWPGFLGPNRNGISVEKNLIAAWPENGPREVWRVKGGVGMSGLAISQGKCVTMVQRGGMQRLVAHETNKGAPLWDTPLAAAFENQMGNGPRATPTDRGRQGVCVHG